MNIRLSIVILSYNSKTDLQRLLPSVFASETDFTFEVIVVDNGSKDETLKWLESSEYPLKTLANQNTGFAHGNNLGMRLAQGGYILLLNPDTVLEKDTLRAMVYFMQNNPQAGIAGCKVRLPEGKLDPACRRRFPDPWMGFKRIFLGSKNAYNFLDKSEDETMEVDSVMGAFLMIRRSVIEKIGLLDEKFFMYGEDLDWCYRCKEAGFQVWYCPEVFITHYKGSSSRKVPFKALKWFHDAMWVFYGKHYFKKYPKVFSALVFVGIYGRLAVLWLINLVKREKFVSKR